MRTLLETTRFVVVAIALIGTSCASARRADGAPPVTRGPCLQLATPDSIVVTWRTAGPTDPVVHFGKSVEALDRRVSGKDAIVTRLSPQTEAPDGTPYLHSAPEGTRQYEARLTGLEPSTTYYYAVYDGEQKLAGGDEDHRFRTHPPAGKPAPMRFWVVGDSGTGGRDQRAVYDAMQRWVDKDQRPLDFYVHLGDIAYPDGTDAQLQDYFFEIYQPTLRNTVCWPTMGNHEGHSSLGASGVGPYYDAYVLPTRAEAGGVASGMEAYYSFDYANVHFVCLDSHDLDRRPEGAMARWLKEDLEKTKADWLIAFWHHPPYTKGSHDSDLEDQLVEMRTHIMPILEAGGVDLVLTGHSHIYERSMLIDGAYATPTVAEGGVVLDDGDGDPDGEGPYRKSAGLKPHQGAVQVVAGNGGAQIGRKGTLPLMRTVVLEYGSVIVDVDVDGNKLSAIMVDRNVRRRDLFSIVKEGEVSPTRIQRPRTLPPFGRTRPQVVRANQLPPGYENLIEPNAQWQYLGQRGTDAPAGWNKPEFEAKEADGWKTGVAGIGYGDADDKTILGDMKGNYRVVFLRKEFDIDDPDAVEGLGLSMNYDDGFVVYLNGREILREGVGEGRGREVVDVEYHEAVGHVYFPLDDYARFLVKGKNVLSVEGHNANLNSTDLTVDPFLLVKRKK